MNTRNAPSHQARKQKHNSAASGQPLPSAVHHRTSQPRQNGCEPIDGALPDSITITPDGSCFTCLLGIQRMHWFSRWRKMIQLRSFHFFLPPPSSTLSFTTYTPRERKPAPGTALEFADKFRAMGCSHDHKTINAALLQWPPWQIYLFSRFSTLISTLERVNEHT